MTCIVAYDIEDNKVRTRLSRYLKGKGIRLQKSVFAIRIERHSFKAFLRDIEKITTKDGKVAVFRLCIGCQRNALQLAEVEKTFHVF